jgi:hypothetical protein
MKNELNRYLKNGWAIAQLNIRTLRKVWLYVLILPLALSVEIIIDIAVQKNGDNALGLVNTLLIAAVLSVVFLATGNFYKTLRLNAKKRDYFTGVLILIALMASLVSALFVLVHYAFESPIMGYMDYRFLSLYWAFGFSKQFFVLGFLQMFGFIFFSLAFVFVLSALQDIWLGWALDVLLAVCVAAFSSVGTFRHHVWKPFFDLLIFGHPALQLFFTVLGGLALYSTYLVILRRKKV